MQLPRMLQAYTAEGAAQFSKGYATTDAVLHAK